MSYDAQLIKVAFVTCAALLGSYLWWLYKHKQHLAAMRDRAELRRRMLAKVGLCDECGGSCNWGDQYCQGCLDKTD